MKLSQLLQGYPCMHLPPKEDPEIRELVCHTGEIRLHSLWFCIPGERSNPTLLLPNAVKRGAAAIVLPQSVSFDSDRVAVIRVKDVRDAVARLFYRFYGLEQAPLRFHGITGTNGKTSTAHILEHLLRWAGNRTCLIGTVGVSINGKQQMGANGTTTPPPEVLYPAIKNALSQGVTDVILEVSSHGIAQKRAAPISFQTAIFTNLSPEHMDYHRTMEHYASTKAQLFSAAKTAIYCADEPYAKEICAAAQKKVCYGEKKAIRMNLLDAGAAGTDFLLAAPGETETFHLPIAGTFQAKNAALALLSASQLGIPFSVGREALCAFSGIPGRMERITDKNDDVAVFLDYAHTEEALRAALSAARALTRGAVFAVFGCGGDRDTEKRAPMGRTAEELADYVFVTSDNPRKESPVAIIKDILRGMRKDNHRVYLRREKAIRAAILSAHPGDLILLAGKGHESYEEGPRGKLPFSEREIAKKALEERKRGILNREGT